MVLQAQFPSRKCAKVGGGHKLGSLHHGVPFFVPHRGFHGNYTVDYECDISVVRDDFDVIPFPGRVNQVFVAGHEIVEVARAVLGCGGIGVARVALTAIV